MVVQVYDPQHSGFQLLKRGPSVARMCEAVATRVVTQPGQAPAVAKGRKSYLAYYHACASGGIPSFKFSTGV